jgi:glycosyltransferase involved in cell wall biosynthesis
VHNFTLTIVIPTYNRNRELNFTIGILLPQLSKFVNLVVLDNCSPIPVSDTVSELIDSSPFGKFVSVVTNNINIGGDANIVRCFEHSSGDWIWIVADDDVPDENAVSIIQATIEKNPRVGIVNYYAPCATHPVRGRSVSSSGVAEYIRNMDSFGSHLFLPASVYKSEVARKYIKIAHRSIHTLSAHISVALCYMQDGGSSHQSHETIIRFKEDYTATAGWSRLAFGLGCGVLSDLIHNSSDRRLLKKKIADFLPFRTMYAEALVISRDRRSNRCGYLNYSAAINRVFLNRDNIFRFLFGKLLSVTLLFPDLSFSVFVFILEKLKGKPPSMARMKASSDMLSFFQEDR